jgi:hypothetical protein
MVLLGDEAQVEAQFSPFEYITSLMQDTCTVCVECTTASDIILDAPGGTPR